MSNSHYLKLAYLERWGSLVVCRHGIVHMRWEDLTLRMQIEAFRRLSGLIEGGGDSLSPFSFADGEISIATDEFAFAGKNHSYRVGIGSVELSLPADGWAAFLVLIRDAADRLDQILAQDDWRQEPDPFSFELDARELTRPHQFSLN